MNIYMNKYIQSSTCEKWDLTNEFQYGYTCIQSGITYLDAISARNSFFTYKFLIHTIIDLHQLANTQMSECWHGLGDDDVASELNRLKIRPITFCHSNYIQS